MRCLRPCGSAALCSTSHPQPAIRLHGHARASRHIAGAQRRAGGITQLSDIQVLKDLKTDGDLDGLELRDVKAVSYVSRRRLDDEDFDANAVDEDGLPLVYNEQRIASYWGSRPGELAGRWTKFAGISAPWLTKMANAFIQGKLEERQGDLARDAVDNLEKLGPTFIKLGQIMSIRPDVLPPPVMRELAKLQDKIEPFSTPEARAMVEKELGAPINVLFSEFSDKPIAAASLAQVYRARLRSTGQEVAVKVQRPGALGTISKDLYVMRRAVGVYEQLVKRFTAQTTDYQQLLSTFAEGLYTEMDFRNEALNAQRMRELLDAAETGAGRRLVIPMPNLEYTTRRVLTMEWVTGVKLTTLPSDEIRRLVGVGQEAFLVQLLEIGFFHGDPHPGNLLKVTEGPDAGKLALLDFGLVAEIPAQDREAMVSATIHLANRDWNALIDDFIALEFLPPGADRGLIMPVMDRVLGPYLRGGGAKAFNFQALSQDLLSATLEIPFSVPPYMSLLARSVATLEGIALVADPNYQMVAQAYPFVARKVLRNDSTNTGELLRDMLYDGEGNIRPSRLGAMLQAALGYVADESDGFVDFDAVPEQGASVQEVLAFVLSPEARDLRPLLVNWLSSGLDLFLRDRARKAVAALPSLAPRLPFVGALPTPPPPPLYIPGIGFKPLQDGVDLLAPPLNMQEGVYLQSLLELAAGVLGVPAAELEAPNPAMLLQLLRNPDDQVKELQDALVSIANNPSSSAAAGSVAADTADALAHMMAARARVPVDTLFPMRRPLLQQLQVRGLQEPSSSGRRSTGQVGSSVSSSGGWEAQPTTSTSSSAAGDLGSSGNGNGNGSAGALNSSSSSSAATRDGMLTSSTITSIGRDGKPRKTASGPKGRSVVMRSLDLDGGSPMASMEETVSSSSSVRSSRAGVETPAPARR